MGKGRKKRKVAKGSHKRSPIIVNASKLLALSQRSVNPHEVASASSAASSLYSSRSRVLLVGEGDFSFALSLTATIGGNSLVATSLDSRDEVLSKYGASAQQNIRALSAAGARVYHGVDATSRESLDEALGLDAGTAVPSVAVSCCRYSKVGSREISRGCLSFPSPRSPLRASLPTALRQDRI